MDQQNASWDTLSSFFLKLQLRDRQFANPNPLIVHDDTLYSFLFHLENVAELDIFMEQNHNLSTVISRGCLYINVGYNGIVSIDAQPNGYGYTKVKIAHFVIGWIKWADTPTQK